MRIQVFESSDPIKIVDEVVKWASENPSYVIKAVKSKTETMSSYDRDVPSEPRVVDHLLGLRERSKLTKQWSETTWTIYYEVKE